MVLVSFLLPCFNVEVFLPRLFDSISKQSFQNFEVIAIDDCSTDNTFELLKEQSSLDSRWKVYQNEQNVGLIKTLNVGISLCSGHFIARQDADDFCHLDRISEQVKFIEATKSDCVSCFGVYVDTNGLPLKTIANFLFTQHYSLKFIGLFESPILHAGMLIRRSVLASLGFTDKQECEHIEDFELWNRLFWNFDFKVQVLPRKLYYYTVNNQSVSFKYRATQWQNHIRLSKTSLDSFCDSVGIPRLPSKVHLGIMNRNLVPLSASEMFELQRTLRRIRIGFIHCQPQINGSSKSVKEIKYWCSKKMLDITLKQIQLNPLNIYLFYFALVATIRLVTGVTGFKLIKSYFR